jgi:L-threonylcarbamoyladenylate synthase
VKQSDADRARLAPALRALVRGRLVVYPTETLYGLGADALDDAALQRLVALKGREAGKPIAVLVSDERMLEMVVAEVSPLARRLMQRFWPGPLTLVLAARSSVSNLLTGGSGGIGVRVSSHPLAIALVRALGRPLTAPSANPAGRPGAVTIAAARAYFGDGVAAYLDAGQLAGEPASTVVDMRQRPRPLREGAVALAELREVMGEEAW